MGAARLPRQLVWEKKGESETTIRLAPRLSKWAAPGKPEPGAALKNRASFSAILIQPEQRCSAGPGCSAYYCSFLLVFVRQHGAGHSTAARSNPDYGGRSGGAWHPGVLIVVIQDAGAVEKPEPGVAQSHTLAAQQAKRSIGNTKRGTTKQTEWGAGHSQGGTAEWRQLGAKGYSVPTPAERTRAPALGHGLDGGQKREQRQK